MRAIQENSKKVRDEIETTKHVVENLQPIFTPVKLTQDKPFKSWSIPVSTQPVANSFLCKNLDKVGLISDLHIPFHHAPTIERWLNECDTNKIRSAIIIGDTMDGGHWHPKRGKEQHHGRTWQDDLEVARKIYGIFTQCFEEILVLSGNHDEWHAKHMRGQIKNEYYFGKMFSEYPSIQFSDFEQCQVQSAGKQVRCIHGTSYSASSPLTVAKNYAAKFECGIVMAHQHHAEDGFSRSGKHQVICLGGAIDNELMGYVHQAPGTQPAMTRSFAILQDGWVTHYKEQN